MASFDRIRVVLTGDSSELQRATREGAEAMDDFGSRVGGVVGDISGNLSTLTGGFSTAMGGVATAAAIGVGGLVMLVNSSRDYVRELNEVSKSTGVSITQLQKLSSAFSGLGLEIDKFGDFNKDTLDKLGDAFRVGGGVADDLKEYGLSLEQYNKYLNKANGGTEALIHTFYEMRKAGKSNAEIVNVMETLASDSSHMIDVLKDFKTEAEALNHIQGQSAGLTDESARAYASFEKDILKLSTSMQQFQANYLAPTIKELNTMFDILNQDWDETKFADFMKQKTKDFFFDGDNGISVGIRKLFGEAAVEYETEARRGLQNLAATLQEDITKIAPKADPKDGWKDKEKEKEEAEKAAKSAESRAQAAAAKAKAAREKEAREILTARQNLDKAISDMTIDSNARQLSEFDRQQKALVDTITKSAQKLGIGQDELNGLLADRAASGAAKRMNMVNDMIGYADPNQGLRDTNALIAGGNLSDANKSFLANEQNQRISGDNPFSDAAKANTDQQLKDNDSAMQLELKQNDLLLSGHEDYEKRKAEITAKYNAKAIDISNQNAQSQLEIFSGAASSLADGMAAAFGESSGAAKAAFAISKGITMAQTVLSIQSALAQALATPFPASLAAYAQIASLGMSIISTAKGASSGQFHGGVDSLDQSMNNKSFVLKAGERVVQPEANKKLTAFLDSEERNNSASSGDITINSPLIVKGNVDDPETWNKMLKKNQNNVAQAVRSSQKRNT